MCCNWYGIATYFCPDNIYIEQYQLDPCLKDRTVYPLLLSLNHIIYDILEKL